MSTPNHFDVIIIGGSYSGLAAAMALGRALRKVLIIDSGKPCNQQTPQSHNFLTQDGKSPQEITRLAVQQVLTYDTITLVNDLASNATKTLTGFEVQTATKQVYTATKLIFATGIKDEMPDIKGLAECWGISVLHCPYCHGYEVRHNITGILGNGEYGFEFSKLISNWTKTLTLYTNGKATLTIAQKTILEKLNISIVEKEIKGLSQKNGYVEQLEFKDGSTEKIQAIYTRLPFEQHCRIPEQLGCELTEEGYLNIDATQQTTIKGIYACGDNTTRLRTVANAVAMGTTTGMMINKALVEEKLV